MIVPSKDDWTWEVLHLDKKNNYVLQRARGAEGDVGVIGIPDIELCTFTFLKSGLLDIVDWDSDIGCGVMGPGVKFHYKYLRYGYGMYNPTIGRVDYFNKDLPSMKEIYNTASKTHVKLKTVSDVSDFYCISDPYDRIIWAGTLYWFDEDSPVMNDVKRLNSPIAEKHVFEPENDGSKIVAFSKGININDKPIEVYVPHELSKYDSTYTVTGPKGSVFAKIVHNGVYHKSTEELAPRYVQQS